MCTKAGQGGQDGQAGCCLPWPGWAGLQAFSQRDLDPPALGTLPCSVLHTMAQTLV